MNQEYQKYLSPSVIKKIDNLYLRAKLVVEGFIIGLHKSPYHGFSVEFSEHRPYGFGDEIRHIDWKLLAKTDKLFIKQFEEETNLKTYIILDKSSSMGYGSNNNMIKFDYAKTLSASLAYLMIQQQDAVGLATFDKEIIDYIPPKSKIGHLNYLLNVLHSSKVKGDTKISPILHSLAESIKKRGLIILISDLLDNPNEIINGLRHFRHKGHEVIIFHILDDNEINFNFTGVANFIDSEDGSNIKTDPRQIKKEYMKAVSEFCGIYEKECNQNNIDYLKVNTSETLEKSLIDYLIKRSKLS